MEYRNNIFHSYLAWFVIVYMDDILTYYDSYEEHARYRGCVTDCK